MIKKNDIEKILSSMTLEEKVAQMQQLSANATPTDHFAHFKKSGTIGSFLHVLGSETKEYLDAAAASDKKIPPIFGIDAIHGHALLKEATIFPSQLAMACSFDEEMLETVGQITAREVAADGLSWVFSPVLCLGRDLRWGRIDETFGEDATLAARLGAAIIKGYQKDNLVAACAKHYLAYGEATGGRDSYDSLITERKAREVFLKPFEYAVDAGCMTIMTAYGSIDGTPLTTSKKWLTSILKDELGFDGFVVTDWENVRSLVSGQCVAETIEEGSVAAVLAGNDMSMNTYEFYDAIIGAVKSGKLSETVIDEAVRRILTVKSRLGLLDGERKIPDKSVIGSKEHQDYNYQVALKSCVLLKNNGVLPIKAKKTIAVIGPNADDVRAQYGDWTYFSHPEPKPEETPKEEVYTLLRGIREGFDGRVLYAKGATVLGKDEDERLAKEALEICQDADVVVAVIGDNLQQNGEWRDRVHLEITGRQIELLKRVKELEKEIVVVLVNGKPLLLNEVEKYASAIVETFNGGDMCGKAVVDLLLGRENFSGKLPISFPSDSASLPCYYNQYSYWHGNKYIDAPAFSNYPFGFGLSYSSFRYSKLEIENAETSKNGTFTLSFELTNDSDVDGVEVVQLYYKDVICKQLTPIRTLLDFKRVEVKAHMTKKVEFTVQTKDLGYYDSDCKYCVDEGEFVFSVSGNGKEFQEIRAWIKG